MKTTTFLRIASILALLQFAAHTALTLFGRPGHGAEEIALVEAMKSHHFDFLGSSRSYWDFHFGYALFASFNCLIQAVLFWQLAMFAKTDP